MSDKEDIMMDPMQVKLFVNVIYDFLVRMIGCIYVVVPLDPFAGMWRTSVFAFFLYVPVCIERLKCCRCVLTRFAVGRMNTILSVYRDNQWNISVPFNCAFCDVILPLGIPF